MQAATYLAIGCIVVEACWRLTSCYSLSVLESITINSYIPSIYFSITYILSILTIFCDMKSYVKQHPSIRHFLTILHSGDSISAFMIGYGMYSRNNVILAFGIITISKIFLIHLIARMVTGEEANSKFYVVLQTTRAYVHHVGSFLFLPNESTTIWITTIWRFISMNGHAVLAYRDHIDSRLFYDVMWYTSQSRNLALVMTFGMCLYNPIVRRGFGVSAVGHIAYLVVRIGPVFRLGSIYVREGEEKSEWQKASDITRLKQVMAFKYPLLSLEMLLMSGMIIFLIYLRMITKVIVRDNCTFS